MLFGLRTNGHVAHVVYSRVHSVAVEIVEHKAVIQYHLNATDDVHLAVEMMARWKLELLALMRLVTICGDFTPCLRFWIVFAATRRQ